MLGIERASLILLDKRYEERYRIEKSFKERLNIKVEPFLVGDGSLGKDLYGHVDVDELPPIYQESISYPTWHRRPNAYNCFLSHKKVLNKALRDGIETLLLLEDDVFIEEDFEEIYNGCINWLTQYTWDMLYLGSYNNNTTTPTDHPNIYRVQGCAGWHGVILKRNVIERLSDVPAIGPYDWICQKIIHPSFDCFCIHPSIVSQNDGFSYVEGGHLSKPDRYKL